eukprot:1640438-Amphidinium_carterae.1
MMPSQHNVLHALQYAVGEQCGTTDIAVVHASHLKYLAQCRLPSEHYQALTCPPNYETLDSPKAN